MTANGEDAAEQNWTVRLVGLVCTDVDMLAKSPEEAAEKAQKWADGKHDKADFNDLFIWDVEVDPGADPAVWLSSDQTVGGHPGRTGRGQ